MTAPNLVEQGYHVVNALSLENAFTAAETGQRTVFDQDYFSRLCALVAPGVEVVYGDEIRGKYMRATRAFKAEEKILVENQCCAVQNLDEFKDKLPCCANCMRSLETPLMVAERVRKSLGVVKDPLNDMCMGGNYADFAGKLPTPVPCRGASAKVSACPFVFCSAACEEAGWKRRHAVICPHFMEKQDQEKRSRREAAKGVAAFKNYVKGHWHQGGVNYQDVFHTGLHLVATAFTKVRLGEVPSLQHAWVEFSAFVSRPWDELNFNYLVEDGSENEGPTKAEVIGEMLELFRIIFDVSDEEAAFLTPNWGSRLIGMILLNTHERTPPSPFEEYKDWLASEDKSNTLMRRVCGPKSGESEWKPLSQSCHGQGLYTVAATMNHSCKPNTYVGYSAANDETIVILATYDIAAGDELTISYIDQDMTLDERQTQLLHHYGFECGCPVCTKQKRKQSKAGEAKKKKKKH